MIRAIGPDEVSVTRGCGFSFFKESGLPGTFNWTHFQEAWRSIIHKEIGVILVDERYSEVIGLIGGIIAPCMNTGDIETFETFWYVFPQYRRTPAAIRLLRAFELWSIEHNAVRMKMAHLTRLNPEYVRNMYDRMGYTEQETCFTLELQQQAVSIQ